MYRSGVTTEKPTKSLFKLQGEEAINNYFCDIHEMIIILLIAVQCSKSGKLRNILQYPLLKKLIITQDFPLE